MSFRRIDEKERFPINENYLLDIIDIPLAETWKAMEALVAKGKIRSIGVSNFTVANIEKILAVAKINPVLNQVELHPYLQQQELLDWCKQKVSSSVFHYKYFSADPVVN